MALIAEDGTGLPTAQVYVSLSEADTYFTTRANETWEDADEVDKEAALVRATDGLDSWARGRWKGTKKTAEQALAWPRVDVVDEEGYEVADDIVPLQVKRATAEVALIELTTPFVQQSVSKSNTVSSETAGPVSRSYRADTPTVASYPHIQAMLQGLASVAGNLIDMQISLTDEEIAALEGSSTVFDYEEYFQLIKFPEA